MYIYIGKMNRPRCLFIRYWPTNQTFTTKPKTGHI